MIDYKDQPSSEGAAAIEAAGLRETNWESAPETADAGVRGVSKRGA